MKSDMPAYKDVVDASVQKVRAVLQERGMLDGFTSSLKDSNTAAASEEIVNAISLRLEQYLAENASETIDQVSGRIQAKLDDLGESGVSVSDEAIEKIKSALSQSQPAPAGGDDSISQKVVEVLNGIGSKIQRFKDFIAGGREDVAEQEEGEDGEDRDGKDKGGSLPDQKLFVKFIDEVMPDVAFFDDRL